MNRRVGYVYALWCRHRATRLKGRVTSSVDVGGVEYALHRTEQLQWLWQYEVNSSWSIKFCCKILPHNSLIKKSGFVGVSASVAPMRLRSRNSTLETIQQRDCNKETSFAMDDMGEIGVEEVHRGGSVWRRPFRVRHFCEMKKIGHVELKITR